MIFFSGIYDYAGRVRTVNIAKGNFRFAPVMYLEAPISQFDLTLEKDSNWKIIG